MMDKPLTRAFPELYLDNQDFMIHQRVIPANSNIGQYRGILHI